MRHINKKSMPKDKICANVCMAMAVIQTFIAVHFVVDIALGGETEVWQSVAAIVIAVGLFRQTCKIRKKRKMAGHSD